MSVRTPGDGPRPRVGVVATQGGFAAHIAMLEGRAAATEVRIPADLEGLAGVILPGGESTTMIRLLKLDGLWDALIEAGRQGLPIFGTCAGAILLSRQALRNERPQESMGLLNATIRRNAYGSQVESFETELDSPLFDRPLPVVCIRAPRFLEVGEGVEVLLEREGEPLWVRQGSIWAATFHPELTGDPRVHQAFLDSLA